MVTVSCPAPLLLLAQPPEPPAPWVCRTSFRQGNLHHFFWLRLRLEPHSEGDCIEDGSECPNLKGGPDHGF
jgi:hypothetical protein